VAQPPGWPPHTGPPTAGPPSTRKGRAVSPHIFSGAPGVAPTNRFFFGKVLQIMDERKIRHRLEQLRGEVKALTRAHDDGRIDEKRFRGSINRLYDEHQSLTTTLDNLGSARRAAAAQEEAFGVPSLRTKAIGPVRSQPPSPMDLDESQLRQLYQAAETKSPCTIEIRSKAYSPVTEYSTSGTSTITGGIGQLPPIIVPNRFMSLPYEPSRVSQYLPSAAMNGPSAVWLTHTGNAGEVATVPEAGQKMGLPA